MVPNKNPAHKIHLCFIYIFKLVVDLICLNNLVCEPESFTEWSFPLVDKR